MLGREAATEREIYTELKRAEIRAQAEKGIWTTKEGTKIPVSRMSDSHLVNTLRMLERNNAMDMLLPWIVVFQEECIKRKLDIQFQDNIF